MSRKVETRQVWKYQLKIADATDIEMPKGTDVLAVQVQNNQICLWAAVNDTTAELETRRFYLIGTGHPMPDDAGIYVGTVQLSGGALVLHVFERWSKL